MDPVEHRLFLLDARPGLLIGAAHNVLAMCGLDPLLFRLGVVCLDEARPDQENVANFDVAAL